MARTKGLQTSQIESQHHILATQNVRIARKKWGITAEQIAVLTALTKEFKLSVTLGDLKLLDDKWYVTHAGLLRIAQRRRCSGIRAHILGHLCDPAADRWVFKATVQKNPRSRAFIAYGDASPENTSAVVRGAEMRVAETRAVDRALRAAYGIGLCSIEELGSLPGRSGLSAGQAHANGSGTLSVSNNNQHRLRDRLCIVIRQFNLDPALVKAYAADFCGTQTLKDASRDLVESFISHLAKAANEDRNGLVCKLNSYAQPAEAKP
jgi:hypothetical protein